MLECISFASAAAKGPEPRRTSIFVNNYVDFFLTKPTLSSVFKSYHRPSVLGVGVYCSFYLQLCWKFFLAKPTLPSVLKSKRKPSVLWGGVYYRELLFPYREFPIGTLVWLLSQTKIPIEIVVWLFFQTKFPIRNLCKVFPIETLVLTIFSN